MEADLRLLRLALQLLDRFEYDTELLVVFLLDSARRRARLVFVARSWRRRTNVRVMAMFMWMARSLLSTVEARIAAGRLGPLISQFVISNDCSLLRTVGKTLSVPNECCRLRPRIHLDHAALALDGDDALLESLEEGARVGQAF